MFKKDYLMRLIHTLIEGLIQIKSNIKQGEIDIAKKQITDAYLLLGNKKGFFLKSDLDEIIIFFREKDDSYLKRIEMLSEIMYCDALVQVKNKKDILEKSIKLLEFYAENTKEYSFELNDKLIEMKNEFEILLNHK